MQALHNSSFFAYFHELTLEFTNYASKRDIRSNTETSECQEIVTNQSSKTGQAININEEINTLKQNYFSQLINLLANINFLKKCLQQKDGKKMFNDAKF